VTLEELLEYITQKHDVGHMDILSGARRAEVEKAKVELYTLARELGYSWTAIANAYNKSHSTIIRVVEKDRG